MSSVDSDLAEIRRRAKEIDELVARLMERRSEDDMFADQWTIGERIRNARAEKGWSQSELAEKAGLSQNGIVKIEKGRSMPRRSTLHALAAALGYGDWRDLMRSET